MSCTDIRVFGNSYTFNWTMMYSINLNDILKKNIKKMYAIFHEPQNDMVTGEKLVTGFIWRTCFKIIRSSLLM